MSVLQSAWLVLAQRVGESVLQSAWLVLAQRVGESVLQSAWVVLAQRVGESQLLDQGGRAPGSGRVCQDIRRQHLGLSVPCAPRCLGHQGRREELQSFVAQLAKSEVREQLFFLQKRFEQAWRMRWGAFFACTAANAVATILLDLRCATVQIHGFVLLN